MECAGRGGDVVTGGKVVLALGYGTGDLEAGAPMTALNPLSHSEVA